MEPTLITAPKVRRISAEETYAVREPVLRPGRPPEECVFAGDTDNTTLHLGVYLGEELTGVASFMENSHSYFSHPVQYQLRGMAVLPEFQGLRIGKLLLLEGEKALLKKEKSVLLWFNARETAIRFYRKHGYQTTGDLFMIPHVCMHIVMYKELT